MHRQGILGWPPWKLFLPFPALLCPEPTFCSDCWHILMPFVFFLNNCVYLFVFGCAGSSLLHGPFSGLSEQGLRSSCGAQACHCSGFSVAEHRLSGAAGFSGSRALEHGLGAPA